MKHPTPNYKKPCVNKKKLRREQRAREKKTEPEIMARVQQRFDQQLDVGRAVKKLRQAGDDA